MRPVVPSELATWLRQQRQARGWSVMEMGRRLCEAAKASGDNTVPGKEAMCRNIRRWESSRGFGVSERYMLHYCKALDVTPQMFGLVQERPWEEETKSAPGKDDREHGQDLGNFFSLGQEDDDEVMRRRAFLLNVAVLAGIGRSDPLTALETLRRELGRSFPDGQGADVSEWNEIALEYGETYPITAPAELLKSLIVDFAGLQEAFQRYPQDVAR